VRFGQRLQPDTPAGESDRGDVHGRDQVAGVRRQGSDDRDQESGFFGWLQEFHGGGAEDAIII
jgi:hypothetical protein